MNRRNDSPTVIDLQLIQATVQLGAGTALEVNCETGIPMVTINRALLVLSSRNAIRFDDESKRYVARRSDNPPRWIRPRNVVRCGT
jgi:hypothetical protein